MIPFIKIASVTGIHILYVSRILLWGIEFGCSITPLRNGTIEIRYGGRAYLVKDDNGQLYVRGRRFLRLDDHNYSHHSCRAVNFGTLSPFMTSNTSINDSTVSSPHSHLLQPHFTYTCAPDSSSQVIPPSSAHSDIMQSQSDAPSSPISQSVSYTHLRAHETDS